MLQDETCFFLAVDFDKQDWHDDAAAFLETCRLLDVPAALERSCSGRGGHVWLFFEEAVPAVLARKLGAHVLTETMERRPDIGLDSYDRFFPNQDTLPQGGFGNLIALPLQKHARAQAMRLPTYDKPRIISCAEEHPHHIAVPRGCLPEVQHLLRTLHIAPVVRDERCAGQPLDVQFQGALRPGQHVAAGALLPHDIGVLAATTAFGKTVVAAWLIAQRGVNTLVLVHRRQLLDQWVERLSTFLGLDRAAIGRIGGGRHKPTGRYIGEGFDDARLDTLFITLPISWPGTVAQYVGRLHRLHEGKRDVQVYDYADLQVAMLARMFDRRCRAYEAIGYTLVLPASATPGWPSEVPLPSDPFWKRAYGASVRRLVRDGVDVPLAGLFMDSARPIPREAEGISRARSATEAFLYRRLETLPETTGIFRLNAQLSIPFDGWSGMEVDLLGEHPRVAVELDGPQHLGDPVAYRRDRRKDQLLQENGYLVLRFLAEDVGKDLDAVLDAIHRALAHRKPGS